MRFWDTSAIVPLAVEQPPTARLRALARHDPGLAVWWGTPVECTSAIARLEREGVLDERAAARAVQSIARMSREWLEVDPTDAVRSHATRVLRAHLLRAADALQLGAALVIADGRPSEVPFVTLDERLAAAARREGFAVIE